MRKVLEYSLKFLEQREGLPGNKQALLVAKLIEFGIRRALSKSFIMKDIWGIRHRYSDRDVMGFKTVVGVYELEEQVFFYNALKLSPVTAIVDVGSAVGTFTSLFAKYAPNATVYSFEPNPFSSKYQREQIRLNGLQDRVEISAVGLGSTHSTERFSYVDGLEGSLWGRFSGPDNGTTLIGADIEIITLDSSDSITSLEAIDFVKLDIEGFELPALLGMRNTLIKYGPVVFCEMALSFLIEYDGNRYKETFDFIESIGYEPFLLKGGRLVPYVWPETRVMNLILLPKDGGSASAARVREAFCA